MNIAEEIIEWLYAEQLRVDEVWSYRLPTGFAWWADEYCQTIEFLGEESGPRGETGYLMCVRTELLCEVDLTDAALAEINALPMRCASMSGPVYDAEARRLDLWSTVRVTDDNGGWMRFLLGAAAVTQLTEARMFAPMLATGAGRCRPPVTTRRPDGARSPTRWPSLQVFSSGPVTSPARGVGLSSTMSSAGMNSGPRASRASVSAWSSRSGDGLSICHILGDQPHPLYGNGLLCVQSFPVDCGEEFDGIRLALSLNAADLTREPAGYGIGSYSYSDGAVHFSGFLPNALHKPGLLANVYNSAAARAQRMAARFVEGGWDADAFSLDAGLLARRRDQRRAAMPAAEPSMRGCPMMRARAGGD